MSSWLLHIYNVTGHYKVYININCSRILYIILMPILVEFTVDNASIESVVNYGIIIGCAMVPDYDYR